MRTTKRSFLSFHPRECDSFAEYLHEQSLQGWHFKEWRFGLVFEKGEQKDIIYDVEISPKASEQDMRPSEDTKDFADYCEVAGWKLLDSHGKLCIFKQEREDAFPIVEPAERFESIAKEEHDEWFRTYFTTLGLAALYIFEFFTFNFERWVFDNLMLAFVVFMVVMGIAGVLEGVGLVIWKKRQKQRLEGGEILHYQGKRISVSREKVLFVVILIFLVINVGMRNQIQQVIPLLILFVGIGLIAFIVSWWRPLGESKQFFEMGGILLLAFVLIGAVISGVFTTSERPEAELHQSVFGSSDTGNTSVSKDGVVFSSIDYEIYRSPYSWVINKLWNDLYQDPKENSSFIMKGEDTEKAIHAFGADQAFIYGNEGYYWYWVRYPDCMVKAYVDSNLTDALEGIEVLKEHLQIP